MIIKLTFSPATNSVTVNFKRPEVGDVWLRAGKEKGVWTHNKKVTAGPGGATGTITGLTSKMNYYLTADTDNPNTPGTYGYAKFKTL